MAFVNLVPVTASISMVQGWIQEFTLPTVQSPGGANIDLSAWTSLACKMVPPSPVPYGSDTTFGTVAGASGGVLTMTTGASDLATVPPGTAKFIITGKPTSGDAAQLLASGTLTVNAG